MRIRTKKIKREMDVVRPKMRKENWKMDIKQKNNNKNNHNRKSTNRLAMATFWRTFHTFHHEGKFSPAWCGWGEGGVHALPISLYLPSRAK